MHMGRARNLASANKRQVALNQELVATHVDTQEPFDWILTRFYLMQAAIKPDDRSKEAEEVLGLAMYLTPFFKSKAPTAVFVAPVNEDTTVIQIGGGEDRDYSLEYEGETGDLFADIEDAEVVTEEAKP